MLLKLGKIEGEDLRACISSFEQLDLSGDGELGPDDVHLSQMRRNARRAARDIFQNNS